MKSRENRGVLWKGTTEKIKSQEGESLANVLGSLMKIGLPLMRNVFTPLTNSVFLPYGLTAAASVADPGIHQIILGSGTAIITLIEEMEDIMKIIKCIEESGLLKWNNWKWSK